jgi:hypothetical protein
MWWLSYFRGFCCINLLWESTGMEGQNNIFAPIWCKNHHDIVVRLKNHSEFQSLLWPQIVYFLRFVRLFTRTSFSGCLLAVIFCKVRSKYTAEIRMDYLIVGLGVTILVAVGFIVWTGFIRRASDSDLPYVAVGPVLSPAEYSFYGVLQSALGKSALILCKVRVVDVIKPRSGLDPKIWRFHFDRIVQKEFDFVLCDPDDLSVRCVIELDNASQSNDERQKRNEFLTAACQAADVKIMLVDARRGSSIKEIRELAGYPSVTSSFSADPSGAPRNGMESQYPSTLLVPPPFPGDDVLTTERIDPDDGQAADPFSLSALVNEQQPENLVADFSSDLGSEWVEERGVAAPVTDDPTPASEPASLVNATDTTSIGVTSDTLPRVSEVGREAIRRSLKQASPASLTVEPHCPRCQATLVKRKPKSGKFAGQLLWTCSTFPECRYAAPFKAHADKVRNDVNESA